MGLARHPLAVPASLWHQRAIGELGEEATDALCHSLKILRANLSHP